MQLIHAFGISPAEYQERGQDNQFPEIRCCPLCAYPKKLHRHGFYFRHAVFFYGHFRIAIVRFQCVSCRKTFSVLPDFLLPFFQHSLDFVLNCLRCCFNKIRSGVYHQLVQFYRRRFEKNLNRVNAFFRDHGFEGVIPEKTKAIKLLEMIGASPEAETFAKRFKDHFQTNFMAD